MKKNILSRHCFWYKELIGILRQYENVLRRVIFFYRCRLIVSDYIDYKPIFVLYLSNWDFIPLYFLSRMRAKINSFFPYSSVSNWLSTVRI